MALPDTQDAVPGRDTVLARRLSLLGLTGALISAVAIGTLHFTQPGRSLDPMSRTISEYALLSDGWIFSWGVVLLAICSVLVLGALVVRNVVRWRSWASLMIVTWSIGLVGLVVCPKQGFGINPSLAGRVHWTWTLIAFFSLPIGSALMCWHRRGRSRWPRWAVRLSMMSGGWFIVLTGQTMLSALTSVPAWRAVGLTERVLSFTEIAIIVLLSGWVLHDTRSPSTPALP